MSQSEGSILFIGGTGRSGTTLLKRILSNSGDIGTVGSELRLFVDPEGIIDLYVNLTRSWDPFRASDSIHKFLGFWEISFTTSGLPRLLRGIGVRTNISPLKYRQVRVSQSQKHDLNQLAKEFLTCLSIKEERAVWYGTKSFSTKPKFFSCKQISEHEFKSAVSTLIRGLKRVFCGSEQIKYLIDDTPYSLIHCKELKELVPRAKFINIVRHPLDVLCSYSVQRWSPGLEHAAVVLEDVYAKLIARSKCEDGSVMTIRLEDIYFSSEQFKSDMSDFLLCDMSKCLDNIKLSSESFGRHKSQLTGEQLKAYSGKLKFAIDEFGYE